MVGRVIEQGWSISRAARAAIHALACRTTGLKYLRTRPYRPQTQRQGSTLHPHPSGRLGLRPRLRVKHRTHHRA
jgi:hypothetical protein